jgi:hypothetical protein
MSNKHKHQPSHVGALSAPITEQTEQPAVATSAPTPEKSPEPTAAPTPPTQEGLSEQTLKQLALNEERNQQRLIEQARMQELADQPQEPEQFVGELAAQGMDVLHEAFKKHQNKPEVPYVPPPRTPRQMQALQEELEAGARASARAAAQQAARPQPKPDAVKEGFTTPVYRPGDAVPDPVKGGVGTFGPD